MNLIISGKRLTANKARTLTKLKEFLEHNPIDNDSIESEIREALIPFAESLPADEYILYDGNIIWNVKRLTRHFEVFINNYSERNLTKYLYYFFSLQCGSIAHYNKQGWFDRYPTVTDLKMFFNSNEFGQEVVLYPPAWSYDSVQAVNAMNKLLINK